MPDSLQPSPDVDAAIARVLDAEQRARDAVERCEAKAQAIGESAELRCRVIAERAARRVSHVHAVTDRRIAERLTALRRESQTLAHDDSNIAPARLADAIDRLAAELVGLS